MYYKFLLLTSLFSFISALNEMPNGLGGAFLDIICTPSQVKLGEPFTINFKYNTTFNRKVDAHIDILNADTKEWYSGNMTKMDKSVGFVSLDVTIPENAVQPFIYKVFVAPSGEPFPNMLAEKGLSINIGNTIINPCEPFESNETNLPKNTNNDYVQLESVKLCLNDFTLKIKYNLVTEDIATLNFDIMSVSMDKFIYAGESVDIEKGENNFTTSIIVPHSLLNTLIEPFYCIVTMVPLHKTWEERIAEDRKYNIDTQC